MKNAPISWNEYFETHAEFAKLAPKSWTSRDGNLSRMYFGESYLQRKIVTAQRGSSYYDQHRIAKGDTSAVVSDDTTWVGDEQLFSTIRESAGECDLNELWQRLVALDCRPKSRRRR